MFGCSTSAKNRRSASAAAIASSSLESSSPLSTTQRSDTLRSRARVDPPHAAVGDGDDHLVLAGDDVAGRELGLERKRRPAFAAEPRGAPGHSVAAAADWLLAASTEATALGHDRHRVERGLRRIAERHRLDLDQPGPEVGSRARARPAGRGSPQRSERRGRQRTRRRRRGRGGRRAEVGVGAGAGDGVAACRRGPSRRRRSSTVDDRPRTSVPRAVHRGTSCTEPPEPISS